MSHHGETMSDAPTPLTEAVIEQSVICPSGHIECLDDAIRMYEHARRLERRNAELEAGLRDVLAIRNNIEVLGEWEGLDINHSLRKKERARIDAVVAQARALLEKPPA